ncbi:ATP-binding protein [Spiractinospora alimapuensis]|uniref:ATP-binding protein n=1 Tax=Spiractinospora alimapuensis TaxID=2820884 RepID=UPI001F1C9ADC|nr:ATP-binding protein [Spiractinospora alimapuensis]QVQ50584.1 ATP-binding protein [Spiractinospora alimapuensis]
MTGRRFAGVPGSVALVRAWTRNELHQRGTDLGTVEEAALVVSELATNAIRHSRSGHPGGSFLVELDIRPSMVRISVIDQGTDGKSVPMWGKKTDPLTEHGHGLNLVASLVERWTTITNNGHCTVTTDLPTLVPTAGGRR